jgi:hypothetical protein
MTMINGWGKYSKYKTRIYKPQNISLIKKKLKNSPTDTFICRGLGRSYGDSSINDKIIDLNVLVIYQLKNYYLFY